MINLPNNGSIVILDDKYMEAEPLIKFLSKRASYSVNSALLALHKVL